MSKLTLDELIGKLEQLRYEGGNGLDFVAVEAPLLDLLYIDRVELVGNRAYIVAVEVERT